jgi:cell wall-associated NlpC family hydrolase
VSALRTFAFPGPSIKLAPIETLSFGCQLAVARIEDPFAITASGAHVPLLHLAPVAATETDFVAVAERFLGTPYLWGGKSSLGIDCSGLLQLALAACGIPCPRDSDMQEQALGNALAPPHDLTQLRRGDLLFWKGHVAIVRDQATLVHANASLMAVTIEPIAQAVTRTRSLVGEIVSIRRLS